MEDGAAYVMSACVPPAGVACETVSNGFSAANIATDGESWSSSRMRSARGGYSEVSPFGENWPLSVNAPVAHVPVSQIALSLQPQLVGSRSGSTGRQYGACSAELWLDGCDRLLSSRLRKMTLSNTRP